MATTTYRGLTIRIGGDTTSLQKALSQVNKSITITSSEAKKLGSAMKLDPTNLAAYNMQLGHMSNQAVNVAQKLAMLKQSASQVGKLKFADASGAESSVEELASKAGAFGNNMENAAGNLAAARTQADSLLNSITKMHRNATSLTKEAEKMAKLQVSSAFSLALDTKSENQVDKQVDSFAKRMNLSAEKTQKLKDEISSLKDRIVSTFSSEDTQGAIAQLLSDIGKSLPAGVKYATDKLENLVSRSVEMGQKLAAAKKTIADIDSGKDAKTVASGKEYQEAKQDLDDYKKSSSEAIEVIANELEELRKQGRSIAQETTQRQQEALEAESGNLAEIADQRSEIDSKHLDRMKELNAQRDESLEIERRADQLMEQSYSNVYINMRKAREEQKRNTQKEKDTLRGQIKNLRGQAAELQEEIGTIEVSVDVVESEEQKNTLLARKAELETQYNSIISMVRTKEEALDSATKQGGGKTREWRRQSRDELFKEDKALSRELAEEYDQMVERIHEATAGKIRPFDGTEKSLASVSRYIRKLDKEIEQAKSRAEELTETLTGKGYSDTQLEDITLIQDEKDSRLASERLKKLDQYNTLLRKQQSLVSQLSELSEIRSQIEADAQLRRRKFATDAAIAEREGFIDADEYVREHYESIREEASKPIDMSVSVSGIEDDARSVEELRDAIDKLTQKRRADDKAVDESRNNAYRAYVAQKEYVENLEKQLNADEKEARKNKTSIPIARFDELRAAETERDRLEEVWRAELAQKHELKKSYGEKEAVLRATLAAAEERESKKQAERERAAAEENVRVARETVEKIQNEVKSFKGFSDAFDLSEVTDVKGIDEQLDVANAALGEYESEIDEVIDKLRKLGVTDLESPDLDTSEMDEEAKGLYERYKRLSGIIGDLKTDISRVSELSGELELAQGNLAYAVKSATAKTPMQEILDEYHETVDDIVAETETTASRIAKAYGSVDDDVNKALGNVSESLREIGTSAGKAVEDGKQADFMSGLVENAKSRIDELKDAAEGYVRILSDMGVDITDEAFNSDELEGNAKLIYERYINICTAIENAEGKLSEMSGVVDNLRQKEDELAGAREKHAKSASANIEREADDVASVEDAQKRLNDAVAKEAQLREKAKKAEDAETSAYGYFRLYDEEGIDELKNYITAIRMSFSELRGLLGDDLIGKIIPKIKLNTFIDIDSFDQLENEFSSRLGGFAKIFSDDFKIESADMLEYIADHLSELKIKPEAFVDSIVDALSDIPTNEVGSALFDNMNARTIEFGNAQSELVDAMADTVNAMIAAKKAGADVGMSFKDAEEKCSSLESEVKTLEETTGFLFSRASRLSDTIPEISDITEMTEDRMKSSESAVRYTVDAMTAEIERLKAEFDEFDKKREEFNNRDRVYGVRDEMDEGILGSFDKVYQEYTRRIYDIFQESVPDLLDKDASLTWLVSSWNEVTFATDEAKEEAEELRDTYKKLSSSNDLVKAFTYYNQETANDIEAYERLAEVRRKAEALYIEHGTDYGHGLQEAIRNETEAAQKVVDDFYIYYSGVYEQIRDMDFVTVDGSDDEAARDALLKQVKSERMKASAFWRKTVAELNKESDTLDTIGWRYNVRDESDKPLRNLVDVYNKLPGRIEELNRFLELNSDAFAGNEREIGAISAELVRATELFDILSKVVTGSKDAVKAFGKNFVDAFRNALSERAAYDSEYSSTFDRTYLDESQRLENAASNLESNADRLYDTVERVNEARSGLMGAIAEGIAGELVEEESAKQVRKLTTAVDDAVDEVHELTGGASDTRNAFDALLESSDGIRESLNDEAERQHEAAEAAREAARAQEDMRESVDETTESVGELADRQREFTDEQRSRIDDVRGGMISQDAIDRENDAYRESVRLLDEREEAIRNGAKADEEMAQRAATNAEEINRKEAELAKAREDRRVRIAQLEARLSTASAEVKRSKGENLRARAEARETIKQIKEEIQGEIKDLNNSFGFEVFKAKNGNTDPKYIEEVVNSVIEYLDKGDNAAAMFRSTLSQLVDDYNLAVDDIQKWEAVTQFQDLMSEIEKTDATIANLSDTINSMHAPDELLGGMVVLNAKVKELEDAYKSIASLQSSLSSVVRTDPANIEAMSLAMHTFGESERLVSEQIDVIREKISRFDSSEIEQFTDSTKSARQQLFDASQEATNIKKVYSEAQGELNHLIERQSRLRQNIATLSSEMAMDEFSEQDLTGKTDEEIKMLRITHAEYFKMKDTLEEYEKELEYVDGRIESVTDSVEELGRKSEEASKSESMAKQREAYENLRTQLAILVDEYDGLIRKSREFAASLAEATPSTFVGNIFGESDNTVDAMDSTFTALVKRAETFAEAVKTFPNDFDIARKSMASIDEAIKSGVTLADELRKRMASVIPDDGMMSYGQIKDVYGSIGEAVRQSKAEVERLSFTYEQALERIRIARADGNDSLVGHLTEQLDELWTKLEQAQEVARNVALFEHLEEDEESLIAVNTQLEKLRKLLGDDSIKLNTGIAESIEEYMKTMRDSTGSNILSSFKREFDALTQSIEESKRRIAKIDKDIEYTPEGRGNEDLTNRRYEENARLIELVNRRTQMYQETLERFGGIDAFDTLNEDIIRLEANLTRTKSEFESTLNGIRKVSEKIGFDNDIVEDIRRMVSDRDLTDEMYDSILNSMMIDVPESVSDEVLQHFEDLVRRLRELASRDFGLSEALSAKMVLHELSQLQDKAEETGEVISRNLGQKPANLDEMVKSAESYVDSMKKMFGDMFSNEIGEQMGDLTSRLERAKERVKEIDAEIEANGSSDSLSKQRVDAIAEAVSIADQRAKLFNETLEQLGGESALDGLTTRIRTATEEFTGIRLQIEKVRNQLVEIANTKGLDKNWVDRVMNAGLNNDSIEEVDESVQNLILRLMELSEAQSNVGQSLSLDMMLDALSKYRVKASETAEGIQNDFKNSVKVELDDTISKNMKKFSDSMKDGFLHTGVDDAIRDMGYYGDVVEENSKRLERMRKILKEKPTDSVNMATALEALDAYIDALEKKIDHASAALHNWNFDEEVFDFDAFYAGTANAEYERAKASFEELQQTVEELEKKLKEAKEAKEKLGAAQDTSAAEKSINDIEQELDEARNAADEAAASMQKFGNTAEFSKIDADVGVDMADLERAKRLRDSKFAEDFNTSDFSSAFEQATERMADYAERAGQKIVESANTIDSAYRDMRKTVDGTEAEFEELHNAAIKFSQSNAISADTLLTMESLGGQLGVAVDRLQEFGEVAANLDIATDIDAEDIALQLGQMTNIMSDLDDTTFVNVADALVRLGNNTATTESKIMAVAERMAAIANVTSMTTPELMAWSAAIASTGQRSESAATAINNSITGIGQAVAEGGATLDQFAKIAGMSADEFKEKWKNSSSEALEAFVKGLGALTDDSTSAIAALDSVGISSVRQETALLALSQTIGNLDNSLRLAKEGFNDGGDAAREAAQKSEGFSGSLAILQNNVSDLGESLGSGVLPFMHAATTALELLTNLLNSLPASTKTVIVGFGGISAVLATILPTVDRFIKGWKNLASESMATEGATKALVTALSKVGNVLKVPFTALKTMLTGTAAAEAEAAAGATALGGAATGAATGVGMLSAAIGAIGIPIIIGLITVAVDWFQKWREHEDMVRDATIGLSEALDDAAPNIDKYNEKIKASAKSTAELHDETEKTLKAQAEFSKTVNERWSEVETNSMAVAELAKRISDLSSKQKLNKEEQTELRAMVKAYNDETGESLEIIDATTGKLNMNTGELKKNSDAWIENAESQAAQELYIDAIKNRIKAEEEQNAVKVRLMEIDKELDEANKKSADTMGTYNSATLSNAANLGKLRDEKNKLQEDEKTLQDTIDASIELEGKFIDRMTDETKATADEKAAIEKLESALESAGDSTENYAHVSEEELIALAKSYDGNIEEMMRKLKELEDANAKAVNDAPSYQKPSDQELEAFKRENEKLYEDSKRARDDFYDKEKRLRDQYYDSRKNDLDDDYEYEKRIRDDQIDEYKKNLDGQYELEKQARDKSYEDRKREYDNAYEQEKRFRDELYDEAKNYYDKVYTEEKRKRDAAYDEAKQAYDDLYDEEKRIRDDAYDDRKDELDRWLDDYKDSLDEEVDAFEKATDERLKLMEEEYEQKKKLIEDEEEQDTSDIDARIQAIKDQTAAEEKAAKLREREEKIAEATAKRDKYSKGSKPYEKYDLELQNLLTEYANEDEKERRDEYIEYLEGMKDDVKKNADERQDILKDSYDREKEEYEARRNEEKEALQRHNEELVEIQKVANEQELETLKRTNEIELEEIKRDNDVKLEAIKQSHEDELTEIKNNIDAKLQVIKNTHEDELTVIKNSNEDKLTELKNTHDAELNEIKFHYDQTAEAYKRSKDDELTEIKRKQEEHLELLKYYHEQELLELKRHHEDELTNIKNNIDDENEAYKNGGVGALEALRAQRDEASNTIASVGDAAGTIPTKVNEAMTEAATALANGAGAIVDGTNEVYRMLGLPQLPITGQQVTDAYLSAINSGLMETAKISAGTQTLNQTLTGAAQAGAEAALTTLGTILGDSSKFSGISSGIVNGLNFKMIPEDMMTKADLAMQNLSTSLTSNDPKVREAAQSFVKTFDTELTAITRVATAAGSNVPVALANELAKNGDKPTLSLKATGEGMTAILDWLDTEFKTNGENCLVGWNNGFAGVAQTAVDNARMWAEGVAEAVNKKFGVNSPSRLFAWIAEMVFAGWNKGWDSGSADSILNASDTAKDITSAMSDIELSDSFFDGFNIMSDTVVEQTKSMMDNIVDTMREREDLLQIQAERMARIMEDGFDPTLTAAFEAIDTIDTGKMRRSQAAAQSVSNVTNAPVINVTNNFSGMSIRDDTDIDRISAEFERRMRRILAAQIG